MQIGHVISQLRTQRNISQRQLANEINVSPGLVGLWETNKRLPSLECFVLLIDFFSVSADLLLENDRELKPNQFNSISTNDVPGSTKILDTFVQLNEDNQDILIGEAKKLLKNQRLEEKRISRPKAKAT